jgi:hypothetical protein
MLSFLYYESVSVHNTKNWTSTIYCCPSMSPLLESSLQRQLMRRTTKMPCKEMIRKFSPNLLICDKIQCCHFCITNPWVFMILKTEQAQDIVVLACHPYLNRVSKDNWWEEQQKCHVKRWFENLLKSAHMW